MTSMTAWLRRPRSRALVAQLDRLPCGGWPETTQGWDRVLESIPLRLDRRWTMGDLLLVAYEQSTVDPRCTDVWRMREWDRVLERARDWDRGEESR